MAPATTPSRPALLVGIGASAGGLQALERFFQSVGSETGASFIVLQHLSPRFKSLMPEILARCTSLPMVTAESGKYPASDTVQLLPPGQHLTLDAEGRFQLVDRGPEHGSFRPIDEFFISLAATAGPRSVGIVLSGTGSDGSEGVRAIRAAGGCTLAQAREDTANDAMPQSAIDTRMVDQVLAVEKMGLALAGYRQRLALRPPEERPAITPTPSSPPAPDATEETDVTEETEADRAALPKIFALLRQASGIDFARYKPRGVARRIHRRMSFLKLTAVAAYADCLRDDPGELNLLHQDLLIGVTQFFRDAGALQLLHDEVLVPLQRQPDRTDLRVWVVGCATGEEAYSVAMLLEEAATATGYAGKLSVFATDVHRGALETAACGLYAADRLSHVAPERVARFFKTTATGQQRVKPSLRRRIVFAAQNVLSDPPFTRMDVVICRNLLIYFDPAAQERTLRLLHYSLLPGGHLLLGASEGLGIFASEFRALDATCQLYVKTSDPRLPPDMRQSPALPPVRLTPILGPAPGATVPFDRQLLRAYDQLLAQHVPPGLLVTPTFEIRHYFGAAAQFLAPPTGRGGEDLLQRSEGDLRLALSTLVPDALRASGPVTALAIPYHGPSGSGQLDLTATAMPGDVSGRALVYVTFQAPTVADPPAAETPPREVFVAGSALQRRVQDLERELQATVEELQTTNEELQSANEEMLAANEELQTTNEELHSVNAEFERKNLELTQLNDDLNNLLASTEVATVFLDPTLHVRKFNAATEHIFSLLPQDIGRALDQTAYLLPGREDMLHHVRQVLTTGQPAEHEIRSREGRWLLRRTLPFFSSRRTVEGVVLTFTDTTQIKTMQTRVDLALEASGLVSWDWDVLHGCLTTHVVGGSVLSYPSENFPATTDAWLAHVHPEDLPQVWATLDAAMHGDTPDWNCEHRFKTADSKWIWVATRGRVTERDAQHRAQRMLGTTQDIDQRRRAEAGSVRDAALLAYVLDAVVSTDPQGIVTYWNKGAQQLYGATAEEMLGRPISDRMPAEAREAHQTAFAQVMAGQEFSGEVEDYHRDGSRLWADTRIYRLVDARGRVSGTLSVARDSSARRSARARQQTIERQLNQSQKMDTLGTLAGGIAHDFNNLLTSILGFTGMARHSLPPGHPADPHLQEVQQNGQRASDLVRRILAFSRTTDPSPLNPQPIVLSTLVSESLPMLRTSLPTHIELRTVLLTNGRTVLADASQLQQVLFNLCLNSIHAIGAGPGLIEIKVSNVALTDPLPPVSAGHLHVGDYLCLTVSDSGGGMTEAVLEHVFDPFFTTKAPGQGTGLGLSIVHTIVTAHGGAIGVTSQPGKGTTFSIYFVALAEAPPPAATAPEAPPILGQGERIALVDDEDSVRSFTQKVLEKRGFRVTAFSDPEACLAAILAHPADFDLLVTDQRMPQMSGIELAQGLRTHGCLLPVLVISGYAGSSLLPELERIGRAGFLGKPFGPAALGQEVMSILAGSQAATAAGRDPT